MPIRLQFIDWQRPALAVAAGFLAETYSRGQALDLRQVIVALPGGRAGRRLLEILVDWCAEHSLALVPPHIVTLGTLPEELYEVKRPLAHDLTQEFAWIEALRQADSKKLGRLVRQLPDADDLFAWLPLGKMLAQLHRELAADVLDFGDVAKRGADLPGFAEARRWEILADIQAHYLRILDDLQLWDRQTARRFAIQHNECRTDKDIVLVGAVDMDGTQRAMLDLVAERVTALVFAPPDLSGRFDEHGCLRPAAWQETRLDTDRARVEIADGPTDQADAVLRAIAGFGDRYAAEDIVVGVPDESLVPYLEQRLGQCELAARYGVGIPLARSGPYRLLEAAAEYLNGRRFSSLAALLRHPAIGEWLLNQKVNGDWLTEADNFFNEHLPVSAAGAWPAQTRDYPNLKRASAAIERLTSSLDGDSRPLATWLAAIAKLLADVYGARPLDRESNADRQALATCEAVRAALLELQGQAQLSPRMTGGEALRLVLRQIEGGTIPPHADPGAIELLGWLELPLDDAPALIVTGMNEGIVPMARNGDLFLPNALRRQLQLEDNDRRYARDAYALSVLLASRQDLKIIASRRTGDGDPLAPSRLLLACGDEEIARRALAYFSPPQAGTATGQSLGKLRPGSAQSRFEVPKPEKLAEPVTSMRVTEFRDYLACPYRYYLRHRLGLEQLDDAAEELDAGAFGSLLHTILDRFGQCPLAASIDAGAIAEVLSQLLDELVVEQFGAAVRPAVGVQAEQVRLRLQAFSRWQADWAADGWQILHTEKKFSGDDAALLVDGRPMGLRGRIDRIDFRAASNEYVVFDYKTGDSADEPDKRHRQSGEWIDLQLPLYRYLVKSLGIDRPRLGYIAVPKRTADVGEKLADWTDDELRQADEVAADIVRKVRGEEFWPRAQAAPAFCEDLAAICQDDQFGAAAAAAEALEALQEES